MLDYLHPSNNRLSRLLFKTYGYLYDLSSDIVNWLYLFTFLLCFYSLKLFFQNMFLCYLILSLFVVTNIILFYSNLQKINEQGFNNLSNLNEPHNSQKDLPNTNKRTSYSQRASSIIKNKISIRKFAFTDIDNWQKELSLLKCKQQSTRKQSFSSNDNFNGFSSIQPEDSDSLRHDSIYPESALISSDLDQLIDLVLNSFVKSWYNKIHDLSTSANNSDLFTDELKVVFQHAIKQLLKEFSSVDLANLIILTILPILTNHFNSYVIAKNIIQSKNDNISNISSINNGVNSNGTNPIKVNNNKKSNRDSNKGSRQNKNDGNFSRTWNLLISKNYNHHGKLHPVINKFRDNDEFIALNCKNHLRNKMNKLLPILISNDRKLSNCLPVVFLLREILVNFVLFPTLKKVSDPDFYNRQVVDRIGNSISDRNKVNQLRAELQKHSKTLKHKKSFIKVDNSKNNESPTKKNQNKMDSVQNLGEKNKKQSSNIKKSTKKAEDNHSANELLEFKLILSTNQQSFENFLKKVQANQSLVDLRQLKFYINLQFQRTLRNEEYQKLTKLFENTDKLTSNNDSASGENFSNTKKLRDLYNNYKTLLKRLQAVQNIINEKISQNSSHLVNHDDMDSVHSKQSSGHYYNNINKLPTVTLQLSSLLNDPLLLSYYMEYMELQHKLIIVQFWLNVNGIKDPLENLSMIDSDEIYNDDISDDQPNSNKNSKILNKISDNESEIEIDIIDNEFFHDFIASSNDIRTIFNNYFHNSLIVTKNKVIYSNVSNFVKVYEKYFCQSSPVEKIAQSILNDLERKLSKARKSILVLQAEIFQIMENDLPNFINSNTYLKLLANENWNPTNSGIIIAEKDQASIASFSSQQRGNNNSDSLECSHFTTFLNHDKIKSLEKSDVIVPSSPSGGLKIQKLSSLGNINNKYDDLDKNFTHTKVHKNVGIVSPNDKDTFFGDDDDLIVSKDVIDAVEHVLMKIVDSSNNSNTNINSILRDDYKPKKLDTKSLKNSLFGLGDDKDSSDSFSVTHKINKNNSDVSLNEKSPNNYPEETDTEMSSDWEEEEAELDSMLYEMISAESDPRSDNANIAAAATLALQNDKKNNNRQDGIIVKPPPLFDINFTNPGTSLQDLELNLSGEILRLGNEIDDLNNQTEILKPLIQKAELTNNTAELRILNKASSSLLRELNLKSLQRQQYIVQENENNLFGKAKVNITGYITKVDESTNKEYTSYIVEVRKATSTAMSDSISSMSTNKSTRINDSDTDRAGKKDDSSDDGETLKVRNNKQDSLGKDDYGFYSTWVVSRRFSLFYMLHQYLKSLYPNVKDLYFPSKKLNISLLQSTSKKFQEQQTNLIETRKKYLNEYLKNLLVMPEICEDSIFRLFLSSQRFNNDIFSRLMKISKMKKLEYMQMEHANNANSNNDGVKSSVNSFEDVTAKLYNGLASGLFFMNDSSPLLENSETTLSMANNEGKGSEVTNDKLNNAFEMQNELNSYDFGLKPFTTTTSSGKMTTSSVSGSTLAVNMGQISSGGIFSSTNRNVRQRGSAFNACQSAQVYSRGTTTKNLKDSITDTSNRPVILSKSIPFVKPICDLILSIFKLNNRANSWLRGRAILVLLQRLFGSTIEKKIRDFFGESSLKKNEGKVTEILSRIREQFFPNGKFRSSSEDVQKTKEEIQQEKQKNRREAQELLEIFITDISSKIVGIKSSKFASLEIHNLFQNEILNTHLVYTVFDEILDSVFAELSENDDQEELNFN